MGRDKAELTLDGGPTLRERSADLLATVTNGLFLSIAADDPRSYALPTLRDRWRDAGPLAGLDAGFHHARRCPVAAIDQVMSIIDREHQGRAAGVAIGLILINFGNVSIQNNSGGPGGVTLSPGTYNDLSITGGNVFMEAGLYYFTGEVKITGGNVDATSGVMLFINPTLSSASSVFVSNFRIRPCKRNTGGCPTTI